MSKFIETPIWNSLRGHRITSNSRRNWQRARSRADERFKEIEGEYYRPDSRGKELVRYEITIYPPPPPVQIVRCSICREVHTHHPACPKGLWPF